MSVATMVRLRDFALGAFIASGAIWLLDHDVPWPALMVMSVVACEIGWRAWKYRP
jgi:hypothetical protein